MQTRSKSKNNSRVPRNDGTSTNSRQIRACRMKNRQTSTTRRIVTRRRRIPRSNAPSSLNISSESEIPVSISRRNNNNRSPIKRKTATIPKYPADLCVFCFTKKDDYLLGDLETYEGITAHKFCLYFAPGLGQNGELNEPRFWGFKPDDVRKELRRGSLLRCSYCHKKGAVIGCSIPECSITFHLPCGIENNACMIYHDDQDLYPSYCLKHRPKTPLPSFKERKLCTICQEFVKNSDKQNLLYVPCCHSYFHRQCLLTMAFHQGMVDTKCPNCKNRDDFIPILKQNGIYLPDCGWHFDPQMYAEVFRCSALQCKCEQGREHNGDNEWELFTCDHCGSSAIHVSCAGLEINNPNNEWMCEGCQEIVAFLGQFGSEASTDIDTDTETDTDNDSCLHYRQNDITLNDDDDNAMNDDFNNIDNNVNNNNNDNIAE